MGKVDVMSREGRKGVGKTGVENWLLFLGFSHLGSMICLVVHGNVPFFCYLNKEELHLSLESTTENMHFFHGCSLCIREMEV